MPIVKNYAYCDITIICINEVGNFITLNKEYHAYGMDEDSYYLFNNIGSPAIYDKALFVTLKQHRKSKLEKLNENRI